MNKTDIRVNADVKYVFTGKEAIESNSRTTEMSTNSTNDNMVGGRHSPKIHDLALSAIDIIEY